MCDITASVGARGSEGKERWDTACDERTGEKEEEKRQEVMEEQHVKDGRGERS